MDRVPQSIGVLAKIESQCVSRRYRHGTLEIKLYLHGESRPEWWYMMHDVLCLLR